MLLCRLKDDQVIPHTGMVILEVGMLSGFSLSPGAAAPTDLIRKVEILPERVTLYLDSVSGSSSSRSDFERTNQNEQIPSSFVRTRGEYTEQ